MCTDLGCVTPAVRENLTGCDFVMLESNYDPDMLESGPYPYILKKRISSKVGHLSNPDCASEIFRLVKSGGTRFVLGHLSEENNRPELALSHTVEHLAEQGIRIEEDCSITVASRMGVGKVLMI